MPIYHLSCKTLSRSAGRNAVQAVAYRSGSRFRCERTGRLFDSSRRRGVVSTRIVVPRSETTIERQAFWNMVEGTERRRNSTVAREFEIAIPHELDRQPSEALVIGFAQWLADHYGILVDVAIHDPSGLGDDRNRHAHLLTSTRIMKPDGTLGKKVRVLDDLRTGPAEVTAIRKAWAEMCNVALAAAGVPDLVDHRSHAERGITEVPGRKLGVGAAGYEARTGRPSRRRQDHEADVVADQPMNAAATREVERQRNEERRQKQRRELYRSALVGLRASFAGAVAAIGNGRPSPVIEKAMARSNASHKPAVTSRPHAFVVAGSRARLPVVSRAGVPLSMDMGPIPSGKRRRYDEEREAAAMHRRVARALEAEHLAHAAQERAEAEEAAHRLPTLTFSSPLIAGSSSRSSIVERRTIEARPIVTPTAERSAPTSGETAIERSPAQAQMMPSSPSTETELATPAIALPPDGARLALVLLMALQLQRLHKRKDARRAHLVALSGMDAEQFDMAVSAADPEQVFTPSMLDAIPDLAATWTGWIIEDRENHQRRRDARANGAPPGPASIREDLPAITEGQATLGQHGHAPETKVQTNDDASATPPSAARSRRNIVIDYAIVVIGRGGWTPSVGKALAQPLRTRSDWIWQEAHRVCRKQHGVNRPNLIPRETRQALQAALRQDAFNHKGVAALMKAIDGGVSPTEGRDSVGRR